MTHKAELTGWRAVIMKVLKQEGRCKESKYTSAETEYSKLQGLLKLESSHYVSA